MRAILLYRVLLQDDSLNLIQAEAVACPEDESAIAKALAFLIAAPIYITGFELWQLDRCVFKLRAAARSDVIGSVVDGEQSSKPQRRRVLVVDDNKDVLDIMRRICMGIGYSVQTVDRGWHFISAYVRAVPDCIVLDLNLPDIGGFSLLRWLIDVECQSRIIVTSGTTDETELAKVSKLAEQGHSIVCLRKPFQFSDLVQLLGAAHIGAAAAYLDEGCLGKAGR